VAEVRNEPRPMGVFQSRRSRSQQGEVAEVRNEPRPMGVSPSRWAR